MVGEVAVILPVICAIFAAGGSWAGMVTAVKWLRADLTRIDERLETVEQNQQTCPARLSYIVERDHA